MAIPKPRPIEATAPAWCALALALTLQNAQADPPDHPLEPNVAARLINLATEINRSSISVVSVTEGSRKLSDGFEIRYVQRVAAIVPQNEDGRVVRRLCHYDFRWDEQYGWYLQEVRERPGAEEVWIWSETLGEFIVK